jgi:hypothetical protein
MKCKLQQHALELIEALCYPDNLMTPENRLDQIFKIAHVACSGCKNLHMDWRRDLNKMYDEWKKAGII